MDRLPPFLLLLGCLLLAGCPSPETTTGSPEGDQGSPPSGMALSYPGFPSVLYVGEPFGPYLPTVTGGTAVGFDTTTLLPLGISVDKATGALSGTPTVVAPAADYLFWAFPTLNNSMGNAKTTLRFAVISPFRTLTATLASAHQYGAATLLADGRVLVAGGYEYPPTLAEVYHPATGAWAKTATAMKVGRIHLTATLIDRGPWKDQVLLVGDDTTTELYDPGTDTFTLGPTLAHVRSSHTATRLNDGRILLAGGNNYLEADLWDPATNTISAVHPLQTIRRVFHAAALLKDGRVVLGGGYSYDGMMITDSAEIFDPVAGTFTATGSLGEAREYPVAVTLPDSGKVLFVGGSTASGTLYPSTAEVFDPAADSGKGAFSTTGAPQVHRRQGHTANVLPDGKVLVTGGLDGKSNPLRATDTAEVYDPATGVFHLVGNLVMKRQNHFAVSLAEGSVLVGGGDNAPTINYLRSVEKYH